MGHLSAHQRGRHDSDVDFDTFLRARLRDDERRIRQLPGPERMPPERELGAKANLLEGEDIRRSLAAIYSDHPDYSATVREATPPLPSDHSEQIRGLRNTPTLEDSVAADLLALHDAGELDLRRRLSWKMWVQERLHRNGLPTVIRAEPPTIAAP